MSEASAQPAGMSPEQRQGLIGQIARDFTAVHGEGPGCTTGYWMMSDRQLLDTADEYRGKAAAAVGDDR